MGWDDPITNATDWSAVSFVSMFWAALNERRLAVGLAAYPLPAVGADVQIRTANVPTSPTGDFSIYVLQNGLKTLVDWHQFLDTAGRENLDGVFPVSRQSYWEDYIHNGFPLLSWTKCLQNAGINNPYFTRKYPKEFLNLSSSTYNDAPVNTPAVSGDKARCLADGRVHQRVGGTWIETPGSYPDAVTTYGNYNVGDYIGPWIWNELRAVLKQLTYTDPARWTNNPYVYRTNVFFDSTTRTIDYDTLYGLPWPMTLAEAKALAEAYFNIDSVCLDNGDDREAGYNQITTDFGLWHVYASRTRVDAAAVDIPDGVASSYTIEWYYTSPLWFTPDYWVEWNDSDSTIDTSGAARLIGSMAASGGGRKKLAGPWGSLAFPAYPVNVPCEADNWGPHEAKYQTAGLLPAIRWNFIYG